MFHLAERPMVFPAASLLGRTAGPVVDTGIDLPAGGRVYLDETETAEAARLYGFARPDETRRLRDRIVSLEADLLAAHNQLRRLRDMAAETLA